MVDYNTIVVGAGTAGLTAAIYTARKNESVLILEGTGIGGQIATSPCVENYPGFSSISGAEFSDHLFNQVTALGADFEFEEVLGIKKNDDGSITVTSDGNTRTCNKLILATGVHHRKLGLADEERLSGKGVSYCAVCDGAFFKGKTVAVVGGGSSALQSVKLLSGLCQKVYLIHRRDEFRGEQRLADELKAIENVEFILNSTVEKLTGDKVLQSITVKNKLTDETSEIALEGLFVYIGQIPNNAAFGDVVALDEAGYIIAGEDCKTNVEGIYAAGDCRTKKVRQLTTAAADGSVCALA